MRITNPMMNTQMLLNINRNTRLVDVLYNQLSSGKLIRVPSENPIIAARALKFRTTVTEIQQYQRNVEQGLSWMDVSEGVYKNVVSAFKRINEICVSGASAASGTWEDKQKMVLEIEGIIAQLGTEMNASYAGRYIFSGYRTDIPPTFEKPSSANFAINQYFTTADVEGTMSLQKVYQKNTVELDVPINQTVSTVTVFDGTDFVSYNVAKKLSTDVDARQPKTGTVNYIAETGELLLPMDAIEALNNAGSYVNVEYTGTTETKNWVMPTVPAGETIDNIAVFDGTNTVNFAVKEISSSDLTAQYPKDGTIHYITETGELVLSKDAIAMLNADPVNSTITTNYSDATSESFTLGNVSTTNIPATQSFSKNSVVSELVHDEEPIISTNVNILRLPYNGAENVVLEKFDALTGKTTAYPAPVIKTLTDPNAYKPAAGEIHLIAETGEIILGKDIAEEMTKYLPNETLKISYTKKEFKEGEPNPLVYFECTDLATNKSYNMNNQILQLEFGMNSRIPINSLAKDVFTATIYAELTKFCDFVKGIEVSNVDVLRKKYKEQFPNLTDAELDEKIADQLTRENQLVETVLHDRFKNMLERSQKYLSTASIQETDLGVRINRVQLIGDRLDQDRDTFKNLLSKNEDINYLEVMMELNSAESIYQASLKVGANIMQLTLVDFIR